MMALRAWLKTQRLAQNLTMRELAKRMSKPHSYVQRVEEGDRRLDVVEFVWYCHALDVNPEQGLLLVLNHQSPD